MKKYRPEQVVEKLRQADVELGKGLSVKEACRVLGAINEQTWEASGRKLAAFIEDRFGTRQGCKEARLARARWRSLARQHVAD
jgi:hypothetical protein